MRGSGSRGRGRGRGRPPLGSKVSSPTEPAQILLSLSGNQSSPQLYTTSRNVKIDPSVLGDPSKNKIIADSQPRRRGRRRSALNTAIRERILRDSEGSEDTSPLLSSLLGKSDSTPSSQSQDNAKYLQTLKEFGLPTDVPILYDNGEGKLVKLTESVLKSMMSADANVQFHIAEGTLQETDAVPSSSVPSTPVSSKKQDNTMCEMVFDKENKNFVIKETDSFRKGEETNQLDETDLESLKNGAVTEVESDPEAVVMFEVTDNKKVQKCVLSAKDINTLRMLNEQLSKQKSQLASMTNGLSAVEMVGNAQIAELKLKISNTTSVLAQIVERVQGLKNIKEFSTKMLSESTTVPPKVNKQSQVVQLEFIDGNGEKIEDYQVEGTVVENKLERKREDGSKENELMCLLGMVCDENEQSNLISEEQERREDDKDRDIGLVDDAADSLMGETEGESNYLVMNNHHLGQQNMEYMDDMMAEPEHNGNISMENKAQDRYIIDNDGNIINQDESYVVYHDVKEEMTSNEYVIYDGSESVLPDITSSNAENFDEVEEDSQARNEEDCSQEYIVYRNESKTVLSSDIKAMSHSVEGEQYIVYSDDNPDRSQDSINKPSEDKPEDFVMFGPDKISEDEVDSLLEKPSQTSQSSELLTLKDPLVSFTDDHRKKTKDSSELIHKRRSSSNSDSSDKSIGSKKQKLSLQDEIDSS